MEIFYDRNYHCYVGGLKKIIYKTFIEQPNSKRKCFYRTLYKAWVAILKAENYLNYHLISKKRLKVLQYSSNKMRRKSELDKKDSRGRRKGSNPRLNEERCRSGYFKIATSVFTVSELTWGILWHILAIYQYLICSPIIWNWGFIKNQNPNFIKTISNDSVQINVAFKQTKHWPPPLNQEISVKQRYDAMPS